MMIHILERQTDEIVDFLENKNADAPAFYDDVFTEKVENGAMYFEFVTSPDASPHLKNKNKLVVQHPDGYYMAFVIENVQQTSSSKREILVEAEAEHMRLKTGRYIEPTVWEGETINTALDLILLGTRWKRGVTEFAGTRKVTFKDFTNPLKAVLELENIFDDVEVRFRVTTSGGRISGRYVDFVQRIGRDDGAEVELGKNLIGIERVEDSREVYTAMIGVGRGTEEGQYVTFESINGGKNYIEDKDAVQRWSDDGEHLFGIWYVESEEGEEELTPAKVLDATQKAFRDNIDSKVDYKVESFALAQFGYTSDTIRKGDTVRIKDEGFTPPLYLEARVKELERHNEMKEVTAVFGNYKIIEPSVYKQLKDLQKKLFTKDFNKLKRVFGTTAPTDTNVIWIDLSGDFPIAKLYDPSIPDWVAAGPEVAGDLGAYTKLEIDNKYDTTKALVEAWVNPTTTEIDGTSISTGTLSFSQARGGVVHLGQEGGGELRVFTFNSDGEAESIGDIVLEGASFPKVTTDYLAAPNKLETMDIDENVYPTWNYYVDNVNGSDENHGRSTSFAKRTIQAVLNSLPRYLSGEIIITMMTTNEEQNEDLEFKGFVGDGSIRILSESGTKHLGGNISLRHCAVQILFTDCTLKCVEATTIHVKAETCQKVEFENVKFLGENKAEDGLRGYYSQILTRNCSYYRYTNAAITSARGNLMAVENCRGENNKYGIWAYSGGLVTGGGTCPTGTTSQTLETNGNIIPTFTNDSGIVQTTPPETTTVKTVYFNPTSDGAWRENYGGQWAQNTPYQGNWNGWGRYRGYWFHGSQLDVLQGKTIKSMKIKVKRDSRGGVSGGVNTVFRTHNYTTQPAGTPSFSANAVTSSFSWGQEKWVDVTTLKTAFQDGTARGFCIYTTSSANSEYAIFTGTCQVKVTYEE